MKRALSGVFILVPLLFAQDDKDFKPPFTFALYGDDRDGHEVHKKICAELLKSDAKFVIHTGDLVHRDIAEQWKTLHEITKDLRAKKPYYSCKGNHDEGKYGGFEKEFGLTKSYYDLVCGPIHFFFLDTTLGHLDKGEQRTWFEQTATASKSLHKIVVFHEPPFTLIKWREAAAKEKKAEIHTLLAQLKVCAVFCGHDHYFYTTVRDQVRYVTTGGGGAPLYELDATMAEKGDLYKKFYHYLVCAVEEKKISARVFDEDGKEAADLKFDLCSH